MNRKDNFFAKWNDLLKAIKIAKAIATNSKILDGNQQSNQINYYNILIDLLENPRKEHQNSKSLKSLESDFLYYWNEAQNDDTNKFWDEIQNSGLKFKRKDKLNEVFKRGKIKNEIEYNYIIDIMIVAFQLGKINEEQFKLLNKYVGEFEKKVNKKSK